MSIPLVGAGRCSHHGWPGRLGGALAAATLLAAAVAVAAEEPWVIHFGDGGSVRHSGDPQTRRGTEARASRQAATRGERVTRDAEGRVTAQATSPTFTEAEARRTETASDRTFSGAEDRRTGVAESRTSGGSPRDRWRPTISGSVRHEGR